MAMKVVTPSTPTVNFVKLSQRAAVMRAAHSVAKSWMALAHMIGDYADFLRAALRMVWDLVRGLAPRIPAWATATPLPAEAKALVQGGSAAGQGSGAARHFECGDGENPYTAFRTAFGCAARWGWPTAELPPLWAAQAACAKVAATCLREGKEYTYWSY